MQKRMASCAIWALASLVLAAAGPARSSAAQPSQGERPTQPDEPRPALWKISDADTIIYLFGTTHALPAGFRWQSAPLRHAIEAADELVIESLESPASAQRTDEAIDTAINPVIENRPILDRVSAGKRQALLRAIARTDFPPQFYDAMPSWMASLVLAVEDMAKDGNKASEGVEAALIARFKQRGRPISALEDGGAILRQMAKLSDAAQIRMLEGTLDDIEQTVPDQAASADMAWARGDTRLIETAFTPEKLGSELYDLLILKRNRAWAQWLTRRLEQPGTILFAVGAGHLAGPDSLQRLLTAQGLSVQRTD